MGKVKERKDAMLAKIGTLKGKKDNIGKEVKKLTQAEFDALPKALQKELKEFR